MGTGWKGGKRYFANQYRLLKKIRLEREQKRAEEATKVSDRRRRENLERLQDIAVSTPETREIEQSEENNRFSRPSIDVDSAKKKLRELNHRWR